MNKLKFLLFYYWPSWSKQSTNICKTYFCDILLKHRIKNFNNKFLCNYCEILLINEILYFIQLLRKLFLLNFLMYVCTVITIIQHKFMYFRLQLSDEMIKQNYYMKVIFLFVKIKFIIINLQYVSLKLVLKLPRKWGDD